MCVQVEGEVLLCSLCISLIMCRSDVRGAGGLLIGEQMLVLPGLGIDMSWQKNKSGRRKWVQ